MDSSSQIRDLDTGETVIADSYLNSTDSNKPTKSTPPEQLTTSNQAPSIELPQGITFKTFKINKNQNSFYDVAVSQHLKYHDERITCLVTSVPKKSLIQYVASGDDNGIVVLYQFNSFLSVLRKIEAHTDQITSLAFAKNDTFLSSSLDKSVKLWHPSESESLATFIHDDIVSCVAFHPTNPSIFISGQFNNTVLIWDIGRNELIKTINFETVPTALSFSNNGNNIVIGLVLGQVYIYSFPDLNYVTKFIAGPRSKKKMITNKKITSIVFNDDDSFFVASNDSRVRLYSTSNFSVIRKYVGHVAKNRRSMISLSPDGDYIMMPSETQGSIFIYPIDHEKSFKGGPLTQFSRDRSLTCEGFKFSNDIIITGAVFTLQHSENHLSVIVSDNVGNIYLVLSRQK